MNKVTAEPRKFLFVTLDNSCGDLAWQFAKEGHAVKYFTENPAEADVADGFVPKIDDWKSEVDWADVIVFDDVRGQGTKAKKLRDAGKLVIGGTPYTDKLEDDRAFGQEELRKVGVTVVPHHDFTSFDEAIEFVKQNPARYVIKPSGKAGHVKGLLFVGEEDDGRDVIQVLSDYKKAWEKKIPYFQLQKRVSGVEIAVGAFFNGSQFVYPICVNFEHKKLFPGNLGPSTGELGTSMFFSGPNKIFNATLKKMESRLAEEHYVGYIDVNCIVNAQGIYPLEFTCFDRETEILTREGWKDHASVKAGDYAFAINPQTRELAWKRIVHKFVGNYRGKMIKIGSKGKAHSAADVLVTPEHKLLVSNSGKLKFVKAGAIPFHDTKLIRTGTFHCTRQSHIEIPAHVEKHKLGRYKKTMDIIHPPRKIESHAFMKFLGLYLAEGSLGGRRHHLSISQSRESNRRGKIEKVLNDFGFNYTVQKTGTYQISSIQLCKFIESLGLSGIKAGKKFVPAKFKDFAPEYLESLLHGFALGDGSWHKRTGQLTVATTSKRLADDLQELIIKCGYMANLRTEPQKGTRSIGGYTRKNDIHSLSLRKKKTDYSLDKRVVGEQDYDGPIWDVEVEDWHTLLVRRNGKPFFSGNCRFGYPTISIQLEALNEPAGDFFYGLAGGTAASFKAKSGFQVGVRIVMPPFPFNDKETFNVKSKDTVIYFKKKPLEGVHIEDVKLVHEEWMVTGTAGAPLIVVGTGSTMKQAREQAYNRIKNISIPHMYYRDDIGERWFEDSDRLHNWGYLREQ